MTGAVISGGRPPSARTARRRRQRRVVVLLLRRRAMVHRLPPGLEDIVPGIYREIEEPDLLEGDCMTKGIFRETAEPDLLEDECMPMNIYRETAEPDLLEGDCMPKGIYREIVEPDQLEGDCTPMGIYREIEEPDLPKGIYETEAENLGEGSPLHDCVFDALAALSGTCRWIPIADLMKAIHATEEEVEVAVQFCLDLGVFEIAECLAFATPRPDTCV